MQVRIALKDNKLIKITPNGTPLVRVSRFRNYVKYIIGGNLGQIQHLKMVDTDELLDQEILSKINKLAEELLKAVDERYMLVKISSEERND